MYGFLTPSFRMVGVNDWMGLGWGWAGMGVGVWWVGGVAGGGWGWGMGGLGVAKRGLRKTATVGSLGKSSGHIKFYVTSRLICYQEIYV